MVLARVEGGVCMTHLKTYLSVLDDAAERSREVGEKYKLSPCEHAVVAAIGMKAPITGPGPVLLSWVQGALKKGEDVDAIMRVVLATAEIETITEEATSELYGEEEGDNVPGGEVV